MKLITTERQTKKKVFTLALTMEVNVNWTKCLEGLKAKMSHLYIFVKGLIHPKMKILSVFTHPHVVSTP